MVPSPARDRSSVRNSLMPAGSMPLAGSSSSSSDGRRSSAAASPRRCRIPCEYPLTLRSATPVRPARSSAAAISSPRPGAGAGQRQQIQVAAAGQPRVERWFLDHGADPGEPGRVGHLLPVQPGAPGTRRDQPQQDPQGGGLARPVRAQEAEHLARLHREVQAGERGGSAIALGQPPALDHRCHIRLRPAARDPAPGARPSPGANARRRSCRCRRHRDDCRLVFSATRPPSRSGAPGGYRVGPPRRRTAWSGRGVPRRSNTAAP